MGTRNLTMVKVDGKVKVAQYGQWDGYPTGQGVTVAAFVQAYLLHEVTRGEFADQVRKLKFATPKQLQKMNTDWEALEALQRKGEYVPKYKLAACEVLSRDTGAKILSMVNDGLDKPLLHNMRSFLKDTLFCEWAYTVDLDKQKVDVYMSTTKPVASIPFQDFTVYAMRDLEESLRNKNVTASAA